MPKNKITDEEALAFPTWSRLRVSGEINATVPMTTQRDLSLLAYSPGVAVPCEAIAENPETAYELYQQR